MIYARFLLLALVAYNAGAQNTAALGGSAAVWCSVELAVWSHRWHERRVLNRPWRHEPNMLWGGRVLGRITSVDVVNGAIVAEGTIDGDQLDAALRTPAFDWGDEEWAWS